MKKQAAAGLIGLLILLITTLPSTAQESSLAIQRIATGLQNPRGIVVLPDGRLLVAEAGTGFVSNIEEERTGRISILENINGDRDYDDAGERTPILEHIPSYNSLTGFRTGHDEVNGVVDLVLLEDGRLFFTKDDPFASYERQVDAYRGDTGIFLLDADWENAVVTRVIQRIATTNAIVYHPDRNLFYIAESGMNMLTAITPAGEVVAEIRLPFMAHEQQAVPAGLAYDPTTGDVLVALFSGFVFNYYETYIGHMPGDAKIMRYDPDTGELSEAVTGLTTAVDVAVDEHGNIFTLELTTVWSAELMPLEFPLFDPDAPPDAGGYTRFTGRVTMFPTDGSAPIVLADGLDAPTNLTYHEGSLYISTGQGTPGRPIWGPNGPTRIVGEIYVITGL